MSERPAGRSDDGTDADEPAPPSGGRVASRMSVEPSLDGEFAFRSLPSPAALVDRHGRLMAVNAAWLATPNHPELSAKGADYLDGWARAGGTAGIVECLRDVLEGREARVEVEQVVGTGEGARWVVVQIQAAAAGWRGPAAVVLHIDVSHQRRQVGDLLHAASHDSLTGAKSRRHLLSRIADAMRRSERYDEPFALLYLDLDNFKAINDARGHGTGDRVLRTVVERWQQCLRAPDLLARVGGDEFVVLVERATPARASVVAQRLLDALATPIVDASVEVMVRPSLGITHPRDARSPEEALDMADAAMYEAKRARRRQASLARRRGASDAS